MGVIETGAMQGFWTNAGRVRLPPNHRTQESWLAGRLALPLAPVSITPVCALLFTRALGILVLAMNRETELVESHIGLAQVIACEYANIPHATLDEITAEANKALAAAARGFDSAKGEFLAYAGESHSQCT